MNPFALWKYWCDAAMLSLEAQQVIGLRVAKLAGGGAAAETEAMRMVSEKVFASMRAGATLAAGGSHEKVLAQVRRSVRANARRLGGK
jgi:hypothetical protein